MKSTFIPHLLVAWLMLVSLRVSAQAPGSVNTENSTRSIGGFRSSLAETLYIGPNAVITITGEWHIYSKNIWISPEAVISGTGTIFIHNSGEVDGAGGPTIVDGNDNIFLDVNIVHGNNQGIQISNLSLTSDLVAEGWTDNPAVSTLKIGKDFNLSVDGADVWLDAAATGDFVFDSDATISNYRPERMVITNNSIRSHMVKEEPVDGFVFPVGIADGDYTPAEIAGSGVFHVSVEDFASSSSNGTHLLLGGPDRVWHVYADSPTTATVALQHNTVTDLPPFTANDPHYVTQFLGASWSVGAEESGLPGGMTTGSTPPTASIQDHTGIAIPGSGSAFGSFLTKATIELTLPVSLAEFRVEKVEETVLLRWKTAREFKASHFLIERSRDALTWESIGQIKAAGYSEKELSYQFQDVNPHQGLNFYRLKIMDNDGSFELSQVRSIYLDRIQSQVSIYPNPAADKVFVQLDANGLSAGDISEISLSSQAGVEIFRKTDVRAIIANGIDVKGLPGGLYLVRIKMADGSVVTQKLVVGH